MALTRFKSMLPGTGITFTDNSDDTFTIAATAGAVAAADVSVADAGGFYTGTDVEAVLQELGGSVSGVSGAAEWDATVTKGSDESVTSNTSVQADDDLHFTTVTNGVYRYQLVAIYASPAGGGTPDIKYRVTDTPLVGSSTNGLFVLFNINTSDLANSPSVALHGATATAGTGTANRVVWMQGWFVSAAGAACTFYWAQSTSDSNATIVRAGSILQHKRLV